MLFAIFTLLMVQVFGEMLDCGQLYTLYNQANCCDVDVATSTEVCNNGGVGFVSCTDNTVTASTLCTDTDGTLKTGYTEPSCILHSFCPDVGGYVIEARHCGNNGCKHGLVVAMQDQGLSTWYEANDLLNDPRYHDADGQKFMDWRLPTQTELKNIFYGSYVRGNGASLNSHIYWSSREYDHESAWLINFDNDGYEDGRLKTDTAMLRAVRTF